MSREEKKLLIATTIPSSLGFYRLLIPYMINKGYSVSTLSSEGAPNTPGLSNKYEVEMERGLSPLKDLYSIVQIIKKLRKEQLDIVNYGTPKASLLMSIATRFLKIPNRVYTCHGLRYETTTGILKKILITSEKVIAKNSTHILSVSESVKGNLVKDLGIDREKIEVINKVGSCSGIDLSTFNTENKNEKKVRDIKSMVGNSFVYLFVGRITESKGINELIEAFEGIEERNAVLLVCGGIDSSAGLSKRVNQLIDKNDNSKIFFYGHQTDVKSFYQVADVLLLPTYREGLPTVVIEAAAVGVPCITTNATGAKDSVLDNETGYIIEKKNVNQLREKMLTLYDKPEILTRMKKNSLKYAREKFDHHNFMKYYYDYFEVILKGKSK